MTTEAVLNLSLNSGSFNRQLNRSDRNVRGFGRTVSKTSGMIKAIFTAAFAGASWHMIKLASDAEETASKFNTIFRGLEKESNEVADAFARDFGLAGSSAKKLLGNTSDLLTGLGFTKSGALDLSFQVNKLAVDLASFTNFSGGAEGASNALTKALLGERESIKSLGISIQEKDVKEQVAIDRARGLTFATEKQAKASATLTIAIRQSKNAIGDYSRTSDSTANRIKLMSQRWLELKENAGSFLIDGLQVDKILGMISDSMKDLAKNANLVKLAFKSITAKTGSAIAKSWISTKGFLEDSIDGYRLLWTKMTGSDGEAKRLLSGIRFEQKLRKAMLDGVDKHRKLKLKNAEKEWAESEAKKKSKIKADADKAISAAKKKDLDNAAASAPIKFLSKLDSYTKKAKRHQNSTKTRITIGSS